jgi:hypothetical protein
MAYYWKYGTESFLQAFNLTLRRQRVLLQEGSERMQLGSQQVRNLLYVFTFGEALAYALFFGVRIRHEHSDSRVTRTVNHGPGLRL